MEEYEFNDPDRLDPQTRNFIEGVLTERGDRQGIDDATWKHRVGQAAYDYERWMLNAQMQLFASGIMQSNWQIREVEREKWRKMMLGKSLS